MLVYQLIGLYAMPFNKGNEHGFKPAGEKPLDPVALQLKLREGVRERIKAIPGWQSLVRDLLELWVEEREREQQK